MWHNGSKMRTEVECLETRLKPASALELAVSGSEWPIPRGLGSETMGEHISSTRERISIEADPRFLEEFHSRIPAAERRSHIAEDGFDSTLGDAK